MADDSPGKVQALKAMFAEKNNPLMGMRPPGGKVTNRPWRTSTEETTTFKERIISEQRISSQLITKVLPTPVKRPESNPTTNGEIHKDTNGFSEKTLGGKALPRPTVGPKPPYLFHQLKHKSPVNGHQEPSDSKEESRTLGDDSGLSKSRAVAETIASFMFTNGYSHKTSDPTLNNKSTAPPPVPLPRNPPQAQTSQQDQTELINFCNTRNNEKINKTDTEALCNIINFDNYICKSNCNFKRKELPSLEELGPPPSKPSRPPHMVLPGRYRVPSQSSSSVPSLPPPTTSPPMIPRRPAPQKPAYPCPPRPHTPPPLPPVFAPVIKPSLSLREEIEELYEDTLLWENKRPVSLIPEFTAEEEAEELYNDAGPVDIPSHPLLTSLPVKPKDPPPPRPSEYLEPNVHNSDEELYQDADDVDDEEFYEEMPCDTLLEEPGSPLYSNNKKEIEKLKREEEKKIRKELKEKEKREKEMEKLKRKFGLTGDEIPIDDGLVKADSKGGKGGDLPVRRGETVLILRMEGNPSGRWLVKNEKGKIGYVELTNIEVDPLSVKSVMTIRRLSVISASEELYCEAKSEEEGIYEVTY